MGRGWRIYNTKARHVSLRLPSGLSVAVYFLREHLAGTLTSRERARGGSPRWVPLPCVLRMQGRRGMGRHTACCKQGTAALVGARRLASGKPMTDETGNDPDPPSAPSAHACPRQGGLVVIFRAGVQLPLRRPACSCLQAMCGGPRIALLFPVPRIRRSSQSMTLDKWPG